MQDRMKAVRSAAAATERSLAQTIAIPSEHRPVRLPTFPNIERTAVTSFMQNGTLTSDESRATCLTLSRNPVYPVFADIPVTSATFITGFPILDIHLVTARTGHTRPLKQLNEAVSKSVLAALPTSLDSLPIRGKHSANADTFFYVPKGLVYSVRIVFNPSYGTFNASKIIFRCEQMINDWNQPSSFTSGEITIASNTAEYTVTASSNTWFRALSFSFSYVDDPTATGLMASGTGVYIVSGGTVAATTSFTGAVFAPPFGTPPEFSVGLPYEGTRANATSILISNVTRVMNKEGTVLAGRLALIAGNTPTYVTQTSLNSLHPAEKYFGPLEKGCYCFSLPDANCEIFRDCRDLSNYPIYHFDSMGYFTAIFCTDMNADDTSSLAVTVMRHLEFRTWSQLFQLGFSSVPLEEYHASQLALARMGTIFENPIHMATIISMVRNAVAALAPRVAPLLRRAAGAAGQVILSSATNKIGKMAQRFETPKSKPGKKKKPKVKAKPKRS